MRRTTDRDGDPIDVSLRERIRYRFDNILARGTTAALACLGWLLLGASLGDAIMIAVATLIITCPCALALADFARNWQCCASAGQLHADRF